MPIEFPWIDTHHRNLRAIEYDLFVPRSKNKSFKALIRISHDHDQIGIVSGGVINNLFCEVGIFFCYPYGIANFIFTKELSDLFNSFINMFSGHLVDVNF